MDAAADLIPHLWASNRWLFLDHHPLLPSVTVNRVKHSPTAIGFPPTTERLRSVESI